VTFTPDLRHSKVCSLTCALAYSKQQAEKEAWREWDAETKTRKKAIRQKSYYIGALQDVVNKYVRLRDQINDRPCITCGKTALKYGECWDAGHYLGTGAYPEHRFDAERNIHRQCSHCNRGGVHAFNKGQQGKERTVAESYRSNLIKRIGRETVEALEAPHPPLQPSIIWLTEEKARYNRMIKELKTEIAAHENTIEP